MLYLSQSYIKSFKCLLSIVFICLFCNISLWAQTRVLQSDLLRFTKHTDSLISKYPAEKLYLQFDKPYYATSDTIWFKIYLLNAPSLIFSTNRGLVCIDISND